MSNRFFHLTEHRIRSYMRYSLKKWLHCEDRQKAAVWMMTFQELSATLHLQYKNGTFKTNYCGDAEKMKRQAFNRLKYEDYSKS